MVRVYCPVIPQPLKSFQRAQQWLLFTRQWYIFNARWQHVFESAALISRIITGQHKPLYDPENDVGDCVIVFNSKHVALPTHFWRVKTLHYHNKYARTHRMIPLPEVHEKDPTQLVRLAVQSQISHLANKRLFMAHLFIFPEDHVPESMLKNVSFQIPGTNKIPKCAETISQAEIDEFPRVSPIAEHIVMDRFERYRLRELGERYNFPVDN